jgi:hypothetical protein
MPQNFRIEGPWDERHHAQNARALRDVIDGNLNTISVEPTAIYLPSPGDVTLTNDGTLICPILSLPNGTDNGTNRCRFAVNKPSHWTDGLVTIWVVYTQVVSDTSSVRLTLQSFAGDAVSTNTTATAISVTQDFPGCSASRLVRTEFFVSRITVRPQTLYMAFRLGRDGATDANAQALSLLRVLLKFSPTSREW